MTKCSNWFSENFKNTRRLVWFILRRERISSTVWIAALVFFSVFLAPWLNVMFEGEQAVAEIIGLL